MKSNLSETEKKAISNIFTEKYYEVTYFKGVLYVSQLILQLFKKIGLLDLLKNNYISSNVIIEKLNFTPKSKFSLEWMLSFLTQYNLLKSLERDGVREYYYDNANNIEPEKIFSEIIRLDRNIIHSCKLMEYVISEYPAFLNGSKGGLEILFSKDKMQLWGEYFSNDNSGYSVYNSLGAYGVLKWTLGKEDIKLLEIGGGTGSASGLLIDKLKDENMLGRIKEYIFSDISPVFLRLGNRVIMNKVPEDFNFEIKKIDFNKPLIEQGIKENDIDFVYGVNALHVAKDLVSTLKEIYKIIKHGGSLIISECVRNNSEDHLVQEIIFNLLDDYCNVETDPYLRTTPGFLPFAQWRKIFEVTGFKNIEIVLNTDGSFARDDSKQYPNLAAVIKGEKQ